MKQKKAHGLCNLKKIHGEGNHLIIDGYSEADLNDAAFIERFMLDLVAKIKMTPISKALIIDYKSKCKDYLQDGITGTIILAESNITIHTYPQYKFFCLDLFSCNEFPLEKTIKFIKQRLKLKSYKKQLLKRGFYDKIKI